MKIKVSNANTPNWKEVTVKSHIPEELKKLEEMARNIWWAWNYLFPSNLARCMADKGCRRILARNAAAVIRDADIGDSATPDFKRNRACARVDRIFH